MSLRRLLPSRPLARSFGRGLVGAVLCVVLAPAQILAPALVGAGCHKQEEEPSGPSLRLGLLPHVDAATEMKDATSLAVYLESATGANVDMNIAKTYAGVIDDICNRRDDVVQLGGLVYLQAAKKCGVEPVAQSDHDQSFHTLFITAADSSIQSLKDLAGHSFAFGKTDSTSGHLMPAYYMKKEGVDPAVLRGSIFSGGHDQTALAVAGKKVDAGALSESVFKKMTAEGKIDPKSVRVFFTTPAFADDVWVARKDLDPKLREAFVKALIGLDAAKGDQKSLLDRYGATKFVRAKESDYDALRAVAVEEGQL